MNSQLVSTVLLEKHQEGAPGPRSRFKITPIQTGTGNPPTRLIASPQNIGTLRRRAGIMFDKDRTGPQPIYAYLIEHPEGLLLVDTGDTARKSDRGYVSRFNPIGLATDIRVAPEEEIGPQLNALGIRSSDICAVIMTHLHHDHTGGLRYFPHTRILATAENLRRARRGRGFAGAIPGTWPIWFDPEPLAFSGPRSGRLPALLP